MKTTAVLLAGAASLPGALAWGVLGHESVAYLAQNFVKPSTAAFCQKALADTTTSYLANVATWADSYRYTSAGHWSSPLHFIDANDSPPSSCGVDFNRDCGPNGCVVSAIQNYVSNIRYQSVFMKLTSCRLVACQTPPSPPPTLTKL
jgi:hypothetical protein